MCSLKYSHHWQQCLPHSRQTIDTAELIDKLSPQPRKDDCYYSVQKHTISLLCTKSTTVKQQSWDSKTPCLPLREESKEEEVLLYSLLYRTLSDHTPTSNHDQLPSHQKSVGVTGWRPPPASLLVLPPVQELKLRSSCDSASRKEIEKWMLRTHETVTEVSPGVRVLWISHMKVLFTCVCAQTLSHVRLFCDPMDCSPPGSAVCGIFQARILEWVAISSSRGSSWPRDQTHIS